MNIKEEGSTKESVGSTEVHQKRILGVPSRIISWVLVGHISCSYVSDKSSVRVGVRVLNTQLFFFQGMKDLTTCRGYLTKTCAI